MYELQLQKKLTDIWSILMLGQVSKKKSKLISLSYKKQSCSSCAQIFFVFLNDIKGK